MKKYIVTIAFAVMVVLPLTTSAQATSVDVTAVRLQLVELLQLVVKLQQQLLDLRSSLLDCGLTECDIEEDISEVEPQEDLKLDCGLRSCETDEGIEEASIVPALDSAPVISSISPASGSIGTQVVLQVSDLKSLDRIYFGSNRVTMYEVSDTSITFTVPSYHSTSCSAGGPLCSGAQSPVASGTYSVWIVSNGKESNKMTFNVTSSMTDERLEM